MQSSKSGNHLVTRSTWPTGKIDDYVIDKTTFIEGYLGVIPFVAIASTKFCSIIENTCQVNQTCVLCQRPSIIRTFLEFTYFCLLLPQKSILSCKFSTAHEIIRTLPYQEGLIIAHIDFPAHKVNVIRFLSFLVLGLLGPQKRFTYQNLHHFMKKSIRSGIILLCNYFLCIRLQSYYLEIKSGNTFL